MPLVFTNMYLPHVEHLCAGFGMQHVAILAQEIQYLWEMPYSSGKKHHIIYEPRVPFESFKVLYKKENCTQYII